MLPTKYQYLTTMLFDETVGDVYEIPCIDIILLHMINCDV